MIECVWSKRKGNPDYIRCIYYRGDYCKNERAVRRFKKYTSRIEAVRRRFVQSFIISSELSCPFHKDIDYKARKEKEQREKKRKDKKKRKWRNHYKAIGRW